MYIHIYIYTKDVQEPEKNALRGGNSEQTYFLRTGMAIAGRTGHGVERNRQVLCGTAAYFDRIGP